MAIVDILTILNLNVSETLYIAILIHITIFNYGDDMNKESV